MKLSLSSVALAFNEPWKFILPRDWRRPKFGWKMSFDVVHCRFRFFLFHSLRSALLSKVESLKQRIQFKLIVEFIVINLSLCSLQI